MITQLDEHRHEFLVRCGAVRADGEIGQAAEVAAVELRLDRLRLVRSGRIQQAMLNEPRQRLIARAFLLDEEAIGLDTAAACAILCAECIRIEHKPQLIIRSDNGEELLVRHARTGQDYKRRLARIICGIQRIHADDHILHLVEDALAFVSDSARPVILQQLHRARGFARRHAWALLDVVIAFAVEPALHPFLRVLPRGVPIAIARVVALVRQIGDHRLLPADDAFHLHRRRSFHDALRHSERGRRKQQAAGKRRKTLFPCLHVLVILS